MEEFIDEVDSSGNFLVKRKRSDLKERMFMHKVALIIPKAEGGKIILSKRAVEKTSSLFSTRMRITQFA